MIRSKICVVSILAIALASWAGCGGIRTTKYTHPGYDFAFVERVAVLPLLNLSEDPQAGTRATRILITELLATEAVDVVTPGEVAAALNRIAGGSPTPSNEQVIALGEVLDVQALLMGSVAQSSMTRAGNVSVPVVTLDVHMVETETGTSVWAATHTEKGGSGGSKWLGTGGQPISATTRDCARKIIKTLVK